MMLGGAGEVARAGRGCKAVPTAGCGGCDYAGSCDRPRRAVQPPPASTAAAAASPGAGGRGCRAVRELQGGAPHDGGAEQGNYYTPVVSWMDMPRILVLSSKNAPDWTRMRACLSAQ